MFKIFQNIKPSPSPVLNHKPRLDLNPILIADPQTNLNRNLYFDLNLKPIFERTKNLNNKPNSHLNP